MTSETPSLPNAWPGLMRPIATAHELILNRLNQMTRDPRYVSDVEELKLAQQTILDQERELNEARSLIHEADENKFAFVEWRQRAERAEAKLAALQAKPNVAGLVEATDNWLAGHAGDSAFTLLPRLRDAILSLSAQLAEKEAKCEG